MRKLTENNGLHYNTPPHHQSDSKSRLLFTVTLIVYGMQGFIECMHPVPHYHQVFDAARNRKMALECWAMVKEEGVDRYIGELIVNPWSWTESPFIKEMNLPTMIQALRWIAEHGCEYRKGRAA